MKITGKNKKVTVAIILSCFILGGALFYFWQPQNVSPSPVPAAPPLPDTVADTANSAVAPQRERQGYILLDQPSPFAANQPAASTGMVSAPSMPPISSMPAGTPEMPPMPDIIPAMPDGSAFPADIAPAFAGNKVQVIGIILGSTKAAILSNGQSQITVKEGSASQWGKVTRIGKDGIVLDGEYIAMNRQVARK